MYNSILQPSNLFKVGIYIRLSKEDENKSHARESESESVQNQRSLITNYLKSNGFVLTKEYVDDGFTGTNFDRPAFNELISDVESGVIDCIITKDLSRLGRDYIQCGYYIEQYFPLKKVRYISILDQVDTFLESANNDIAPFKALFNDMVSKDTSKKIRSILRDKKQKGQFIGGEPSYGYQRDPDDKGKLIPNPETAPIVTRIFNDASNGKKIGDIIKELNSEGIKTPSDYKGIKPSSRKIHTLWTYSVINRILKNRMYTGDMIQNMQSKLSYKSQKRVALSSNLWIIVENTHEPLISREIYEKIQVSPSRSRITKCNREKRVLEGLIFCKECGNRLSVAYRKKDNSWSLTCSRYSRSPAQRLCHSHYNEYNKFEIKILEAVQKTCNSYIKDIDTKTLSKNINRNETRIENLKKEIDIINDEITKNKRKIDSLYEDKFNELISIETYSRLSSATENKIKQLNNRLETITKEVSEKSDDVVDDVKINEKIREYLDLEIPTRELLMYLIDRIEVDKDKNVEIIYKFKKKVG